ncbi:MAG TPA: TIGR03118 family protein, partial [Polyangiaceae bacterium]|nr:TIGR03118 family protein [Polyangiaceae bacterium]
IDVFDASYEPLAITGDFLDPDLPDGFAPFNVEFIDGVLFVTYAKQDDEGEDDVRGAGNGYVDIYDLDGVFISRLISANELNSPWGLTMTPASFTAAPRRLLVGNFGDGLINVYSVDLSSATGGTGASAVFEGALLGPDGENIAIDGLWALKFAPSTDAGFATDQLYFTAGPDDEEHGVFGGLQTSTLSASAGTGGTGGTDGTGGSPPAAGSGGSGPPLGY